MCPCVVSHCPVWYPEGNPKAHLWLCVQLWTKAQCLRSLTRQWVRSREIWEKCRTLLIVSSECIPACDFHRWPSFASRTLDPAEKSFAPFFYTMIALLNWPGAVEMVGPSQRCGDFSGLLQRLGTTSTFENLACS